MIKLGVFKDKLVVLKNRLVALKPDFRALKQSKLLGYLKHPLIGEKAAVGLDIGTRYIKIVQLKKKPVGYSLEKYGLVELLSEVIVDREFMDRDALIENLIKVVENSRIEDKKVSTVISGKNVIIKKLLTKVPKKKEFQNRVQLLAKENIPFDLKEVVIDAKSLKQEGENVELVIVGAKNELLYPLVDVLKEADLIPYTADITPFVVQAAYQRHIGKEGTYLILNIGFEHILLVIIKDGYYFFDEEIPTGTRTFIEEIQRVCGVGADIAVELLYGKPVKDIKEAEVSKAITTAFKRLLTRMERILPEIPDLRAIILGGGGADISGIREIFANQFNTRCEIVDPLKDIKCTQGIPPTPHMFDIAIGVAISKLEGIGVNLLPKEERVVERNKVLQALDQGLIFYSVVITSLIVGMIGFGLTRKQHRIEDEIRNMKAQQEVLTDKVKEVKELMQKEQEISTKVKVIQDLSKYRYARVKLLDEINRLLPLYTWLVALNEEFADTMGIIILMHGITTSNFAVSNFMKNLETSPYFKQVNLLYTQKKEIAETSTTEFEIRAQFRE